MAHRRVQLVAINGLLALSYFLAIFVFEPSKTGSVILMILGLGWVTSILLFSQSQRLATKLYQAQYFALWQWQNELAEAVKSKFQPMVRTLENSNEVALAARELIVKGWSTPILHGAHVIFLGAAANQTPQEKKENLKQELVEDSERTPTQIYQGAIEEVMSGQLPVFRILNFLSSDEFKSRSKEKKDQYVSWLRNQVVQLKKNRNYIIFENPRAPKWGSSGAAIYTELGFLQFTSASGKAIFLKHPWIARNTIRFVMEDLSQAKIANKVAYTSSNDANVMNNQQLEFYGKPYSVDKLEKYLTQIESNFIYEGHD